MTPSLVPPGAAAQTLHLPTGDVRVLTSVAVPDEPDAATLLLLHGGGTDNAGISWFEAFDAFGPRRRVVALDLPGFGETTIPPVGGAGPMADVVAQVVERLALDAVVAVGVSMGGEVAMQVALRRPDLVVGLVLVAPGGLVEVIGNHAVQLLAWSVAQLPDPVLLPLARLANRYVDVALAAMVADVSALPPPVLPEFAREARRPGAGMGYGRYNQASLGPWRMRHDLTSRVHEIEVPTLLVHGSRDRLVPLAGSRRAVDLMLDAELVVAAGAGHWAQLESPALFRRAVHRLLDRAG